MAKLSPYARTSEICEFIIHNKDYDYREVRYAQIYALYTFESLQRSAIAHYTGYACSTISTMRSKMYDYATLARQLFLEENQNENTPQTENTTPTTIMRHFRNGKPSVPMQFMDGCGDNLKNQQAVYFFKFYNETELLFNKIGTSAKDVVGRLRDEIGEYSKKLDVRRVEVHRIYACGEYPAEGAESHLRSAFIRHYPKAYRKNDRFFNVDIAPEVFDQYIQEYFNLIHNEVGVE